MKQKLPYVIAGAVLALVMVSVFRVALLELVVIAIVAAALLYVWKMPGPRRPK